MPMINFETTVRSINSWLILRLPKNISAKLPSRGMVMVKGTINGFPFQTPLEPDGKGSHWFRVDQKLSKAAKAKNGDTAAVAIESSKEWPEPQLPADVKQALAANQKVCALWDDITPMARWDWLRWIGATNNPETRKKHIEVAFSKLKGGERRPCCFNRSMCTVPEVSKNGVLIEPIESVTKK